MLDFLPDAWLSLAINAILLVGVFASLISFLFLKYLIRMAPVLAPYVGLVQIVSLVLLTAGVYFKGGYSTEMLWRNRVHELEARVARAEQESQQANQKIETKTKEKIKIIRGRTEYITRYIDKEIVKYDTKFLPGGVCEFPQEFIKAHNDSAEGVKK